MNEEKQKPIVLVVDDDEAIRALLVHQLSRFNYEVLTVESGEKALEFLQKDQRVDLILLDQMMKGYDGLSTFIKIREELLLTLPVIMMTAYSSLELALAFMKLSGNDFIQKPLNIHILDVKIQQVLEAVASHKKIQDFEKEKAELAGLLLTADTLSHTIRTPLNTIITALALIQGSENDKIKGNLQKAVDEIERVIDSLNKATALHKINYPGETGEILDLNNLSKKEIGDEK